MREYKRLTKDAKKIDIAKSILQKRQESFLKTSCLTDKSAIRKEFAEYLEIGSKDNSERSEFNMPRRFKEDI